MITKKNISITQIIVISSFLLMLTGCTSALEKKCKERADVAESVMDARLKHGYNALAILAGNNEELRQQLSPILNDALQYDRGGFATFDKTKQSFKDKYYQECMKQGE